MPLAIELAAVRSKLMSTRTMLSEINSHLAKMTSGTSGGSVQQQTLRGTLEWGYHSLTGHERVLFTRLAVFMGSFTLEAAEAICGKPSPAALEKPPSPSIRDDLLALVDKGLLRQ